MKRNLLSSLFYDNVSGSSLIFKKFTEIICSPDYPSTSKKLLQDIDLCIKHFPFFGIFYAFRDKLHTVYYSDKHSTIDICAFTKDFLREIQNESEMINSALADTLKNNPKPVILTHSNSGMVLGAIRYLKKIGKEITVLQTISHPAREGELQAKKLAKEGIKVFLFEDSAASRFVNYADLFLTGGDVVTKKYFINKIGTTALCLLCREYKVPRYLLAGKSRFVKNTNALLSCFGIDQKNPNEVSGLRAGRLKVINYYFEQVPIRLCKHF